MLMHMNTRTRTIITEAGTVIATGISAQKVSAMTRKAGGTSKAGWLVVTGDVAAAKAACAAHSARLDTMRAGWAR